MSSGDYGRLFERLDQLESLEAAEIALARKIAIDRGDMGTTSLGDMIAEFAPELCWAAEHGPRKKKRP